jgi:hypothetical protein
LPAGRPSTARSGFFDHAANYTGHENGAKPLHDPQKVVDAIVRIAHDPEDKEIVGADGKVKFALSNVLPKVAEKIGAKQMHKTQMEKPPAANDSEGAVRSPMARGREVSAGRRG